MLELDSLGVFRISIGGGEPFTRKDIFQILKLTNKYSFDTVINTNATLIGKREAIMLKNISFSQIAVSLDSNISKIHDKMRGVKGAFDMALRGIKNLITAGIEVTGLITLTSYNINTVIQTLYFYQKIGIKTATIMLLCPTGRANINYKSVMYNFNNWEKLLVELTFLKEKNKLPVDLTIVPPNEGNKPFELYLPLKKFGEDKYKIWLNVSDDKYEDDYSCLAGINAAAITANGDVFGCDLMVSNKELCAGNLRKNSFKEIWDNSDIFIKFRNLKISQNKGYCKNCEILGCGGGCRISSYNLTGSLDGPDLRCPLAVKNFRS